MTFAQTPLPIGAYQLVAGTANKDKITGIGGQGIFGGPGNDTLTGYSQTTADGLWKISPLLSGGADNDTYIIRNGTWNIIADLNGGTDVIKIDLDINSISFATINGRDILATDGSTTAILIDPLGAENAGNKIDSVSFGKKKFSAKQLYNRAVKSSSFLGSYTYSELESKGLLNLGIMGLNALQVNEYMANGRFNNAIVA